MLLFLGKMSNVLGKTLVFHLHLEFRQHWYLQIHIVLEKNCKLGCHKQFTQEFTAFYAYANTGCRIKILLWPEFNEVYGSDIIQYSVT